MTVAESDIAGIRKRFEQLAAHLSERQKRLWAGAEAAALGRGGITAVRNATGLSLRTIRAGKRELATPSVGLEEPATQRIRRAGGGRKRAEVKNPGVLDALRALVDPVTRGDPTSPLRWTSKSTRKLAKELAAVGHPVSADVVARLLKNQGYSLQSTRKRFEGKQHPDRDGQIRYIGQQAQAHLDSGQPVISVDTKSKELVGNFKRKGREWQPAESPVEVEAYDFPTMAVGKAVPYGVYDVMNDEGWVSVGVSADTAEFAVNSIAQWWAHMGRAHFDDAEEIVLTADCGGSNGYRTRLWKRELQRFANETKLRVTVLHYPPGTSKWNRVEHRMFSHITMNWRGRPLVSFQTVVQTIANTRTETGLSIRARLDDRSYEKGIKVSRAEMEDINIKRHDFHGEWNYTIFPNK